MAKKKEQSKEQTNKESGKMTLEEAKALRMSKAKKKELPLTLEQKREKFRTFWSQNRSKYGREKELEQVLWLHLKAINKIEPQDFEEGLAHFGLKKGN